MEVQPQPPACRGSRRVCTCLQVCYVCKNSSGVTRQHIKLQARTLYYRLMTHGTRGRHGLCSCGLGGLKMKQQKHLEKALENQNQHGAVQFPLAFLLPTQHAVSFPHRRAFARSWTCARPCRAGVAAERGSWGRCARGSWRVELHLEGQRKRRHIWGGLKNCNPQSLVK